MLNLRKFGLLVVLSALFAGAPVATALADPPPWAPAHGRHKHKHKHHHGDRVEYIYYPAHRTYFDPRDDRWYYLDDDEVWVSSPSRPVIVVPDRDPGVRVFFDF